MKSLLAKILAWLKETFEAVPVNPTDATNNPDPQPEPPSSLPDLLKIKWLGKNYSGTAEATTLAPITIIRPTMALPYSLFRGKYADKTETIVLAMEADNAY